MSELGRALMIATIEQGLIADLLTTVFGQDLRAKVNPAVPDLGEGGYRRMATTAERSRERPLRIDENVGRTIVDDRQYR